MKVVSKLCVNHGCMIPLPTNALMAYSDISAWCVNVQCTYKYMHVYAYVCTCTYVYVCACVSS